jgi:hypothetical protein
VYFLRGQINPAADADAGAVVGPVEVEGREVVDEPVVAEGRATATPPLPGMMSRWPTTSFVSSIIPLDCFRSVTVTPYRSDIR